MSLPSILAVALSFFVAVGAQAGELSTPWAGKSPARSRLIVESSQFAQKGVNRAGIHIRLDKGYWTYWRAPGTSGMPPMFDWSGSENLADDPDTIWPVPLRAMVYGEKINVYRDEVVFPVEFRPADPSKPVKLHVKVSYGTCREMCIPASAEHELTLEPASGVLEIDHANSRLLDTFSGRGPSSDPGAVGIEIQEVRAAVVDGKVILTIRAKGVLTGDRRALVLVEGPEFVRVAEIEPSAVEDGRVAVLKLTVGSTTQFKYLKGKRVRITVVHGERALEQVWVVGTKGSSVAGIDLTPSLPPRLTDRPEPSQ